MNQDEVIKERVARYYHGDDINCATTTLKILSELFEIKLNGQIIDAALGMHGAGQYGAQCGLVEGTLMFIGILGRERNVPDDKLVALCRNFADSFEREFASLQCSVLRPEGFKPSNPPHLCEKLTCRAIAFSASFMEQVGRAV